MGVKPISYLREILKMRKIVNPFVGLEKYDAELKRHDLYKEIKELLVKHEAYDDSPIGHEFVAHFEKELPGIITAYSGDHSFINGSSEENINVVMEAVETGTALKAGLVAAVLVLIYKIIRVIINNPSFKGSGSGGGGRGSAVATKQQIEQLNDQVERYNNNSKELKDIEPTLSSNPLHKEEDSKVVKAAEKGIVIMEVQADGTAKEKETQSTSNENPIKKLAQTNFGVDPRQLAAFFAIEEPKEFDDILNTINALFEGLKKFKLNGFIAFLENTVSSIHTTQPETIIKTLNEPRTSEALQGLVNDVKECLIIDGNISSASELKETLSNGTELNKLISISYGKASTEGYPFKLIDIQTLSMDILSGVVGKSVILERAELAGKMNDNFMSVLDYQTELEDSETYQRLTMVSKLIDEGKNLLKEHGGEGFDGAVARLTEINTLVEVFTVHVLKLFATVRRQTDTLTKFLDELITRLTKANQALETVITIGKTDEGA